MTRVNLERWRGHVTAARKEGLPLAHYADKHGISRHTLYAAHQQLRREGKLTAKRSAPVAEANAAPFVAVQVAASAMAAVRARLPNGVELEFGHLDPSACATLVGILAGLRCSG